LTRARRSSIAGDGWLIRAEFSDVRAEAASNVLERVKRRGHAPVLNVAEVTTLVDRGAELVLGQTKSEPSFADALIKAGSRR
jgi:hypothetical protein